jgi:hypothetical protein
MQGDGTVVYSLRFFAVKQEIPNGGADPYSPLSLFLHGLPFRRIYVQTEFPWARMTAADGINGTGRIAGNDAKF